MNQRMADGTAGQIRFPRRALIHKCDQCGKTSEWSDSWMWWGSIKDSEDGKRLELCSERCKKRMGDPKAAFDKKYPKRTPRKGARE